MTRIVNATPFPIQAVAARGLGGASAVSYVVKATFDLVNRGAATVSKTQRPLQGDTPFMDDIGRSLAWPNDLVAWKPNTGFFVVGAFYQPDGVPAPAGHASFTFGPLQKSLVLHGPRRAVRQPDGLWSIGPAEPMTTVPLRWEYSYGGMADQRNPFGMGQEIESLGGLQMIRLPLIEDAAHPIRSMADRPEPANFTCVPPIFLQRRRKLGTRDQKWALFRAPLPPLDYDEGFANAAPDDQQVGNYPRGDEMITLVNLHRSSPKLSVALPGVRIRVAIVRETPGGPKAEEVPMVIDTVVAAPDDDQLVLLFRGRTPLLGVNEDTEVSWLLCEMEKLDAPVASADLLARVQALSRQEAAAAEASQAAEMAGMMADIGTLLPKANLPPELATLVMTEADPEATFAALDAYVTKALAAMKLKYPAAE